jgi:hypothetical protein
MVATPFKRQGSSKINEEFDSLSGLIRRVVGFERVMVSTDHFRHELLAPLGRAATHRHTDTLVNSGDLCRAVPRGNSSLASCCDAMQAEFKLGDTMVLDRTNGAGMTVRYFFATSKVSWFIPIRGRQARRVVAHALV